MSASPSPKMRLHRAKLAGFTLVQIMIATAIIVIVGLASVQALIMMNRKAAVMRTFNNARAVVQRNIDTAMLVPYNDSTTPAILQTTTATGSVYDDDGGGDNLVNISMMRNGTSVLIKGTLTRIVVAETNPDNADIVRVTFRLNYNYRGRPYSYSMTTLRSMD